MKRSILICSLLLAGLSTGSCSDGGSGGADGGGTGPCRGVTCAGHGVCDDSSGRAVCICDSGFHPDGLLNCVATADPCAAVTCDEWKQCVNGACAIKSGRCDTAADCSGSAPCGADHACQAYDPCAGVSCGGHGKCEASGYGYAAEVKCLCDQGYHADGTDCVEDATGPCKDVACDGWKECIEGTCTLETGRCDGQADCPSPQVCDPAAHDCVYDPCDGVTCDEWRECVAGACALKTGRCEKTGDCQSPQVCDPTAHGCVTDPCTGVACGNGGQCAISAGTAICLCPHAFKPEGAACVADDSMPSTSAAGGWCGIQWPDAAHPIRAQVGDPAPKVYGQIYVKGITESHQQQAGWKAELGVSADPSIAYPVPYHTIAWTPAAFNAACTTCGNNLEYMADFSTAGEGVFSYIYRFSTNNGASWWYCDATPDFITAAQNTPGKATITGAFSAPLVLEAPPVVTADGFSFAVIYTGKTALDAAKTVVMLNGVDAAAQAPYDAVTQRFTVSVTGVASDKYTWLFKATDTGGKRLTPLYVPIWVEATPFDWQDAFLYQIMTDRFLDGDPVNNAPTAGVDTDRNWQGGDFKGIIAKIDDGYFDAIGANALWISSPVMNTQGSGKGMNDDYQYSAYHSYWPIATGWTDDNHLAGVSAIEPHFGTEADLRALVARAHKRGIRILVDMVGNHVHTDSPLWAQHKHDGWFYTPDSPYVCGWDKPIECWFTPYLPDFNYSNADALQTVIDHAIWLIQAYDVDGFRLDAVKHMVMDFTTTLRKRVKDEITTTGVPFYMVGETFDGDKNKLAEYLGPDKLDGQFDFPLYFQVRDVILSQSAGLDQLKTFVEGNDGYYQNRWSGALMSNFMGNHDVQRALTFANSDFARVRMAQTFLFTSPAIPLIYQGDDIGMEGGGDPFNRKKMIFTGISSGQQETLDHLRKLGKFRLAHRAARYGARTTLESSGTLWAYRLKDGADEVTVVLNRGGQATKTYATSLSGTVKDAVSGNSITVTNGQVTISVPAMGTAVIGAR